MSARTVMPRVVVVALTVAGTMTLPGIGAVGAPTAAPPAAAAAAGSLSPKPDGTNSSGAAGTGADATGADGTSGNPELDAAIAQREGLEAELAVAVDGYETAWGLIEAARADLDAMASETARLSADLDVATEALLVRARSVFMHGEETVLASVLSADGPAGAVERAGLLTALTGRDRSRIDEAVNLRLELEQHRTIVAQRSSELAVQQAELEVLGASIDARLTAVRAVEGDLQAREDRKRRIERGVQNGTYACIFDGAFTFRDTWGAPRSGGRTHKGTDVFSYHGAPTYAITAGVIQRFSSGGLGGVSLYLWGDDGNLYYYAHLQGYASTVGQRVEAGELIAYNGATGNAAGGAPHVHFELRPGGGGPINPYPWLAPACF